MYIDRGMKKWGGFILSDHKDVLNQPEPLIEKLPSQTQEELAEQLQLALHHHAEVLIQLAILDIHGVPQQFIAHVEGMVDHRLVLKKEGILKSYPLEMINHLTVIEQRKWYQ